MIQSWRGLYVSGIVRLTSELPGINTLLLTRGGPFVRNGGAVSRLVDESQVVAQRHGGSPCWLAKLELENCRFKNGATQMQFLTPLGGVKSFQGVRSVLFGEVSPLRGVPFAHRVVHKTPEPSPPIAHQLSDCPRWQALATALQAIPSKWLKWP